MQTSTIFLLAFFGIGAVSIPFIVGYINKRKQEEEGSYYNPEPPTFAEAVLDAVISVFTGRRPQAISGKDVRPVNSDPVVENSYGHTSGFAY